MAELSVEESQRLARLFLTGLASEADVQRLSAALPEDQTLALELLAQVQTALDDVAPEGLSKDQSHSVSARVEALVTPRVKRRGLFSLFKRLFRRKPAPAKPEAAPEPASAAAPLAAPAADAGAPMDEGAGLEEMAPIAPSAVDGAPVAPPAAAAGEPVGAEGRQGPATAPAPRRPSGPQALLMGLAALLALGLALWGLGRLRHDRRPAPAPVAPRPAPTPAPTPKPAGPPRRERAMAVSGSAANEPLPAAIPFITPQAAGQLP